MNAYTYYCQTRPFIKIRFKSYKNSVTAIIAFYLAPEKFGFKYTFVNTRKSGMKNSL